MDDRLQKILDKQLEFLGDKAGARILDKDDTSLLKVLTELMEKKDKEPPPPVEHNLTKAQILKIARGKSAK